MESDVTAASNTYRDQVIMWVKDASRAIDYAETRPDLDPNKVAYYGYSWVRKCLLLCRIMSCTVRRSSLSSVSRAVLSECRRL